MIEAWGLIGNLQTISMKTTPYHLSISSGWFIKRSTAMLIWMPNGYSQNLSNNYISVYRTSKKTLGMSFLYVMMNWYGSSLNLDLISISNWFTNRPHQYEQYPYCDLRVLEFTSNKRFLISDIAKHTITTPIINVINIMIITMIIAYSNIRISNMLNSHRIVVGPQIVMDG